MVLFIAFQLRGYLEQWIKGVPPASVAEWTLQGDEFRDFYDGELQWSLPDPLLC